MVAAAEAPARPEPTMITLYLRLLAGLTRLYSKRALSHFSCDGAVRHLGVKTAL